MLTRKEGESILIGDDIRITVYHVQGWARKVKIRVQAPKDIVVLREELKQ